MIFEFAHSYNSSDWLAPLFLLCIFVFLPIAAIRQYRLFKRFGVLAPKKQLYPQMVISMLLLCCFAIGVRSTQSINLIGDGLPTPTTGLLAAIALCGLLLYVRLVLPSCSSEHKNLLCLIVPVASGELRPWILVSIIAGLTEEIVYRSVTYTLVHWLVGSTLLAIVLASAAFAAAHAPYGARTVLFIFFLGALFQFVVLVSGGLYLAIAMHIGYDVGFGMIALRMFSQEIRPEVAPSAP